MAYSPTTPGYSSKKAFNKSIRKRAWGQLRPAIQDVNQRLRSASAGHGARNDELSQWYGFDKAAREAENTRAQTAIGNVLSSLGTAGQDVQAGMAAALRQQQAAAAQEASRLGVASPGIDP